MYSHIIELRKRLLHCLYFLLAVFSVLLYYTKPLFHALEWPLLHRLPAGQSLIATGIASPIIVPLKLTLISSLVILMPYFLYQIWSFIRPALHHKEKSTVRFLLYASIALFYFGLIFAFTVVLPLVFAFITRVAPIGVAIMPDISHYLDFSMHLLFAFGIAFEVPVITVIAIMSGIVTREQLQQCRPYFIVAAFILGMLLTPPDVISQILLAVPMCLLFELGLIFSKIMVKENRLSMNT